MLTIQKHLLFLFNFSLINQDLNMFIVQRCPKDCHPSVNPNLRRVDWTKWGRGCYEGFSLSVCALVSESSRHVDWCENDLKDEWQKDTNIDAGRQLRKSTHILTWYEYRYPDIEAVVLETLIFVVKDKPKSCRTSGTSLSSQFLSSLFTCQQPCPGATSPSKAAPMLPNALHNYCEDDAVYMRVAALLGLNLGSGLFFKAVNIGQSRCLRECLRPFIIANHVIHPRGLCFLTRAGAHARAQTHTRIVHSSTFMCISQSWKNG